MAGGLCLGLVVSACGSSTPTPNAATAKAQILTSYSALFDFANKSVAAKEAVVQDGKSLATALEQGLSSPLASGVAGARINTESLLSTQQCTTANVPAPCAKLNYDILGSNGTVVAPNETGYATYATGKWLVAKVSICSLLDSLYSVEGHIGVPPGCPTP